METFNCKYREKLITIDIRTMELQGKIKLIGETQTFGANGFRKREVVITTEEQYPQSIMIEFTQDKSDLLNAYSVGQNVKISEPFPSGLISPFSEGSTYFFPGNSIISSFE